MAAKEDQMIAVTRADVIEATRLALAQLHHERAEALVEDETTLSDLSDLDPDEDAAFGATVFSFLALLPALRSL